jgi:hypothetical protein
MNDWGLFTMGDGKAASDLLQEINGCRNRYELDSVRMPEFIQTASRYIFHREVAEKSFAIVDDVCIENSNDIGVAYSGQHDCFTQHFFNFSKFHASALENLHCLATPKAMFDAIDLKRPLTQEALDLGVSDDLSFAQKWHGEIWCAGSILYSEGSALERRIVPAWRALRFTWKIVNLRS